MDLWILFLIVFGGFCSVDLWILFLILLCGFYGFSCVDLWILFLILFLSWILWILLCGFMDSIFEVVLWSWWIFV